MAGEKLVAPSGRKPRLSAYGHQGGRALSLRHIAQAVGMGKPQMDPLEYARTRTAALQYAARQMEDFTHTDYETVLQDLGVDPQKGLSTEEAAKRLERHGRNELDKEPRESFWKLFAQQFTDLLVILLLCACVVSLALEQFAAGATIIVIVLLNASIGATMEARAGDELEALEEMTSEASSCVRDGQVQDVPSQDLVPGDIVLLETGVRVPADLRLIFSERLSSEEAALTGESEDVKKDANFVDSFDEKDGDADKEKHLSSKNMVFMGCTIQDGRGRGVVIKTGMDTKMGKIAEMLNNTEASTTPLQNKLHKLGVQLGLASIAVSLIVLIAGVASGRGAAPDTKDNFTDRFLSWLLVAVSLTVAAVPEGLPAAVTICLALGMNRMVKKDALIKNLHSVETLGSASVICSDKTGTLTRGQMTARRLWLPGKVWEITGSGFDTVGEVSLQGGENGSETSEGYKKTLMAGVLCSNAELQTSSDGTTTCIGNSSEKPIIVAAKKVDIDKIELQMRYKRVVENPFSSTRKMMSVVCENATSEPDFPGDGSAIAFIKGAPNFVLDKCTHILDADGSTTRPITSADRDDVFKHIDLFSDKAFRVLAFAYRVMSQTPTDTDPESIEQGLVFAGLMASIDPERDAVIPSIQECYSAGIRVVMITGDYVKTARAIAINIGMIPTDAAPEASVDCEVLREFGGELEDIKTKLKQKKISSEEKATILERRAEMRQRVDEITSKADVYARAKPIDKITIVESLQRQGNVCSMTGDGVNDAPALKTADIGVAMGITGTDVAKGAADMVLTTDDFVSIVKAVEEGRTIYANISKFCFYLLSTNISEVFFVLFSVLIGYPSPLSPTQILWLNLTTDGAPAIALAVEATEAMTMKEGPRDPKEPLIEKVMITGIIVQTIVLTSLTIGLYVIGLGIHSGSTAPITGDYTAAEQAGVFKARTMVILFIVFAELGRAYTSRTIRHSIFQVGWTTNIWMFYSVFVAIALTLMLYAIPGLNDAFELEYIGGESWGYVIGFAIIPMIVDELTKLVYRTTGYGERPLAVRYDINSVRVNLDQDAEDQTFLS